MLLGVTLSLTTCFAGTAARAQDAPATDAKITLDLRDVPFRIAIEALFEKTGTEVARWRP
jgi:hypothetical protein